MALYPFIAPLILFDCEWFRTLKVWDTVRSFWFSLSPLSPPPLSEFIIVYAVAPHSVYSSGMIFSFLLSSEFKRVRGIGTSLLTLIPIVREFFYAVGCVSATRQNIIESLNEGKSIVLVPEGLRGLLEPTSSVLPRRSGFIECCFASKNKNRIKIVPVYIEGQNKTYTLLKIPSLQGWCLSKFWYPWPVLAFGWFGSCIPKRQKLEVRFGTPIDLSTPKETLELLCSGMQNIENE